MRVEVVGSCGGRLIPKGENKAKSYDNKQKKTRKARIRKRSVRTYDSVKERKKEKLRYFLLLSV
jgi:hypothetical protein